MLVRLLSIVMVVVVDVDDAPQICRMALDTETMEGQPDRDTFLGVFYEHYVHWLVEPFWLGDLSTDGEYFFGVTRTRKASWCWGVGS